MDKPSVAALAFVTPFRGEKHPVHGETANARWRFESLHTDAESVCLHLSLRTKVRRGRVDKRIVLRADQNVIYSQHLVGGTSGPMALGHHAMLKFPERPGSGLVATSPFVFGQVFPGHFERPEIGGYSWLKGGAEFRSFESVPTLAGGTVDLTSYPARRGFEDLVMIVNDPKQEFSWTAVTFPEQNFVWFALKDPTVLRQTVVWISNGGRHYPPWNGRHVNVMGLEDVTSNFHLGLAESARTNPLSKRGFPTCIRLKQNEPFVVCYVMGVVPIPPGFDRVSSIQAGSGNRYIILQSKSGKAVRAAVDLDFLHLTQSSRREPLASGRCG